LKGIVKGAKQQKSFWNLMKRMAVSSPFIPILLSWNSKKLEIEPTFACYLKKRSLRRDKMPWEASHWHLPEKPSHSSLQKG